MLEQSMGKSKKQSIAASTKKYSDRWAWWVLAAAILFVAVVRIRLINIPLERDEGEFAYLGQLMLQGIPPYKLGYNMKFPGIYAAYALIMAIFGQSIAAIHVGLLLVNVGAIILMFLVARRLFGTVAAVTAAVSYAILSLSPSIVGLAAHATHFVVFFALAGILLLLKAMESERWYEFLLGGLLLGTAYTMKQPGALFSVFAVIYLTSESIRQRVKLLSLLSRMGLLVIGAALPFGVICLALWKFGVFDKFWFWTFNYGHEYSSIVSFNMAKFMFKHQIGDVVIPSILIWSLAGLGAAASFIDRELRSKKIFLLGFLVLSFIAVCPGCYFREHYFVLMLPALALLSGVAISSAFSALQKLPIPRVIAIIPLLLFFVVIGLTIEQQSEYFFTLSPEQACRSEYGSNPFPESIEIADYLKKHTNENDRILVFGSEPQIYFYAKRHSATGFIYTYPLMEQQKYAAMMQRDMYQEIISAQPKYIVIVNISTSWAAGLKSNTQILAQVDDYCQKNYKPVGLADIVSADPPITDYYWGDEAAETSPQSQYYILIYKRIASN